MIFVTVGTQLPFDRLTGAVAELAGQLGEEIVMQVGSGATYSNVDCHRTLSPESFARFFCTARLVVAHAGIGSILSARVHCKPLVIFPRREALGEHRNDHQLATARRMADLPGVYVAWEVAALEKLLKRYDLAPAGARGTPALTSLQARLRTFALG